MTACEPRLKYVVIETADEEVVTPYANAFLPAAGNVIPYDSNALQDVINGLGSITRTSSHHALPSGR